MKHEQYFNQLSMAEKLETITEANEAGMSLDNFLDCLFYYDELDTKDLFCFECSEPQPELKNNLCNTCYEIYNNSIFNNFNK
jgi:hypothetical protein